MTQNKDRITSLEIIANNFSKRSGSVVYFLHGGENKGAPSVTYHKPGLPPCIGFLNLYMASKRTPCLGRRFMKWSSRGVCNRPREADLFCHGGRFSSLLAFNANVEKILDLYIYLFLRSVRSGSAVT